MRHCLVITLLLAATMVVGCQTQTWKGTDYAPSAGRGDNIFQVHGGLFEVQGSVAAGWVGVETPLENLDGLRFGGQLFAGYMVNDYWEFGAFAEYGKETWNSDDFDDIDVTGWAVGPRIVYNFSNVGTDIVPFCELSGGWGDVDLESDDIDDSATQTFGQVGVGVRIFAWDGIAWSLEGYYRYTGYDLDDTDDKVRKNDPGEFGALLSLSVFF